MIHSKQANDSAEKRSYREICAPVMHLVLAVGSGGFEIRSQTFDRLPLALMQYCTLIANKMKRCYYECKLGGRRISRQHHARLNRRCESKTPRIALKAIRQDRDHHYEPRWYATGGLNLEGKALSGIFAYTAYDPQYGLALGCTSLEMQ